MPYHFASPTYARLSQAFDLDYMHLTSEPVRKLQPALLDILAPFFLPGHDPKKCSASAWCNFVSKKFPVRLDPDQIERTAGRVLEAVEKRRLLKRTTRTTTAE